MPFGLPRGGQADEALQIMAAQLSQTNPSAAATMATGCEPLLANIQTQEAGLIGGGLVLLEEQKTSSLTEIESAVNSGTGAVATSISFLVFSTQAHVNSIAYYASLSSQSSAQELASIVSLAYFANAAAIIAGGSIGTGTTTAQLTTYITDLSTDGTNGPPAAAALVSAQQSACSGGTSTLCTDLTNAIGSCGTYTQILTNAAAYISSGG